MVTMATVEILYKTKGVIATAVWCFLICDVCCSLISYFIILCEVALLIIELQLLAFKTFSGNIVLYTLLHMWA